MSVTFYSPKTLAKLYDVPKPTIWKWIRRGDFKDVLRIGKHLRISHEARIDFEKRNKHTK